MADPELWSTVQQANTNTMNMQGAPVTAALHDGGYVVVWADASSVGGDTTFTGVKAQIFNAAGEKSGAEFLVNTHTTGAQGEVDVAVLNDGNFVVTWSGPGHPGDNFAFGISYQLFSPTGQPIGIERLANTVVDPATDTNQTAPQVAALADGRFVIVFESETTINDHEIIAQVFDADGTKRGTAFQVNTTIADNQSTPDVLAIGDDRFIVAWTDNSQSADDPSDSAIRMRVYQNDGTPVVAESLVNEFTTDLQLQPSIAASGETVMIAFLDHSQGLDPAQSYVAGMLYDNKVSEIDQFLLNQPNPMVSPSRPKLLGLADGKYMLLWTTSSGANITIQGQIINSQGQRVGDEFALRSVANTETIDFVRATMLADGRVALTWEELSDIDDDPSFGGVMTQIIDPRAGQISGTNRAETIYGSRAGSAIVNDTINGKKGDDTIHALDGHDVIDGGEGADTMHGGTGNDTYIFDSAGDVAVENGGAGIDTVKSPLSLTLGASIENGELLGSAANSIVGNELANTLVGNGAGNVLDGRGGADILRGRGGNDIYRVDSVADLVDESVAGSGGVDTVLSTVNFNLSNAANARGSVEKLTLEGLAYSAAGNALANTITGNARGNLLSGVSGNDILSGLGGHDILVGGPGRDIMTGGPGNDTFRFNLTSDSRRGATRDIAKDFDDRGNDRIDLRNVSPAVLKYVGTDAFDGPNQVRVLKAGAHVIVEINRGGSLAADMQILLERTALGSMTKSDFIL
ncbi:MAG: calcium-binding protein [Rhizobiaceae bacterium]|nr:calcium-binding protein [Rhizobiaceae bacterium]